MNKKTCPRSAAGVGDFAPKTGGFGVELVWGFGVGVFNGKTVNTADNTLSFICNTHFKFGSEFTLLNLNV